MPNHLSSSLRRRRNSTNPSNPSAFPFSVGTRIRAIRSFEHHSYQPQTIYVVTELDSSDRTLKAKDAAGEEGNWIQWRDCIRVEEIGWDWLKTMLPGEALDLLAAFDGVENLTLKEEIRNDLVKQIPDLKDRVLEAQQVRESVPAPDPSEES